jgi:hypothetical protein
MRVFHIIRGENDTKAHPKFQQELEVQASEDQSNLSVSIGFTDVIWRDRWSL